MCDASSYVSMKVRWTGSKIYLENRACGLRTNATSPFDAPGLQPRVLRGTAKTPDHSSDLETVGFRKRTGGRIPRPPVAIWIVVKDESPRHIVSVPSAKSRLLSRRELGDKLGC
jgi:hypothetical protein